MAGEVKNQSRRVANTHRVSTYMSSIENIRIFFGADGVMVPSIWQASTDTVAKLLELGATVDATEKRKQTPLHRACERGRLDVVRYCKHVPLDGPVNTDRATC